MAARSGLSHLLDFDLKYFGGRAWIVGVDEAGRGALAGPVCAAALAASSIFYFNQTCRKCVEFIDDSKKLTPSQRESLYDSLCSLKKDGFLDFEAAFSSVEEIEKFNILGATKMAMARALNILNERLELNLPRKSDSVPTLFGEDTGDLSKARLLIDGNCLKNFPYVHLGIVKGDAASFAIAAASVIAKVTRDRFMESLALKYPEYGFDRHKGYGTVSHSRSLTVYGPSDAHRSSFLKKRGEASSSGVQGKLF